MDQPLALIVEDDQKTASLFRQVLDSAGFKTEILFHVPRVVERLSGLQPWLVILDLDLPGVVGSQILEMIEEEDGLRQTKVIAVTSYSQVAETLSLEPDLLLFKPVSIEQFSDFIERFQLKLKYQTTVPIMGEPWDRVTGLYNQSFFTSRLQSVLRQVRALDSYLFAVITISLDQDDFIKNQLGIRDWISALRAAAESLNSTVRPTDTVARFNQDNFYVLIDNLADRDFPRLAASQIYQKLSEKLARLGKMDRFPIRIGILICDGGYENVDEIIRDADTARSLGNRQGGVFFETYDRISVRR